VFVGRFGVGKTSIIYRMMGIYNDTRNRIYHDLHCKLVEVNDKKIKMYLWDTGGQERYL
jgi:GTPase SAR1 family protein